MMPNSVSVAALALALLQAAPTPERATVSPQAFVGTWVGTQHWSIANPPPGVSTDQPVSLTIEVVDGKLTGTMTPFMGGDDGATFADGRIVGDELQMSAVFGHPPPLAGVASGGTAAQALVTDEDDGSKRIVPTARPQRGPTWKDTVKIQFAFTSDRLDLEGTGDVTMNDVTWLKFKYVLSKKRSRY
jgi:hypothetical protein